MQLNARAFPEWRTVPDSVYRLACKCGKRHRGPVAWVRCGIPSMARLDGRRGRLVVVHWCRLPSGVLVDSLDEAEKVLNWGCCGPCDPSQHELYAVTRKTLPGDLPVKGEK